MPECSVTVRWPDGSEQAVYSPSLVLAETLEVGRRYPVGEFVRLTRDSLVEASRRVQEKYGFPCSLAAASLAAVEHRAAAQDQARQVDVLGIDR